MIQYPAYRVAAAHVAPVFLDTEASLDKAASLIAEAARYGARLIAFPESFLPGFPVWAALAAPIRTHDLFKQFAAAAVSVPGPVVDRLGALARRYGIFISMGLSEGTTASVGCLWNSNLLIGDDGTLLNHHRKLVPTYFEKMIWAPGDGHGLQVVETALGRIGALICGENTNPLARYALMAQGEQLHISSYPPVWPTRPPEDAGNYDLAQAIRIRAGAHAFEAKVFNLVAAACLDRTLRATIAKALGAEALSVLEAAPRGVLDAGRTDRARRSATVCPTTRGCSMPTSTSPPASNPSNSTMLSAITIASTSSSCRSTGPAGPRHPSPARPFRPSPCPRKTRHPDPRAVAS